MSSYRVVPHRAVARSEARGGEEGCANELTGLAYSIGKFQPLTKKRRNGARQRAPRAVSVAGVDARRTPGAIPFAGWPTKTFAFHQYSMYLNGEGIQVIHQPAAHTDGDTIVFFRRGDVIATGDVIDTTRWPFVDVKRGGTLQGELDALNKLMDMSILNLPLQWNLDRTLLVPGHGFVYD